MSFLKINEHTHTHTPEEKYQSFDAVNLVDLIMNLEINTSLDKI